MKAALLEKFGAPLRIGEIPTPVAADDELLVRVEACGVCHSDLHMLDGDWPDVAAKMTLPAVLGHEAVGQVVQRGSSAGHFSLGDRVGVGWLYSTCGECEFCRTGHENICIERKVTGVAAPGGFAEFMPVKASHAITIPQGLAPHAAAPLFCAGLTVFHAIKNSGIHSGQRVAVFGAGGLGHLAVQMLKRVGVETLAVDLNPQKLELARKLGADAVINPALPEGLDHLRFSGGVHVALVTAPSKAAYDFAFRCLRRRGTLAVVGIPKEDVSFFADDFVIGEFQVIGSAVGTRDEMRETLALASSGKIHCEVESFPLDQVNHVFERMRKGELVARAVVTMSAS